MTFIITVQRPTSIRQVPERHRMVFVVNANDDRNARDKVNMCLMETHRADHYICASHAVKDLEVIKA